MIVQIGNISMGGLSPLVLIAGPCVVEGREVTLKTAEQVQKTASKHNTQVIFKSSYKKANRTSGKSFVGIGIDKALKILGEVKKELGLPILTDIHTEQEVSRRFFAVRQNCCRLLDEPGKSSILKRGSSSHQKT
jgi:2-dehydro-3-deoxyphosphooctonate aldolase (KDO 8-P synthase)